MKAIAITAISVVTLPTYGHTCSNVTEKCPIDKWKVEFCVTMSYTTFGTYYDFEKSGAMGSHYYELINSCPHCHYSGYRSDFDTSFSEERRIQIREFLSRFDGVRIDDVTECQIAAELKAFMTMENDAIANCYLLGTYLLRFDSTRTELRVGLQDKVASFLIKAVEAHEYLDSSTHATINYLIAEMYRRTAQFELAVAYYDKAIADGHKKDWVEEVAIRQRALAVASDANNRI